MPKNLGQLVALLVLQCIPFAEHTKDLELLWP